MRDSYYRVLSGNNLVFRLSLTRGSNYSVLKGKYLVFWIGGRLQEVPTIGF